jgi:hypothetical protein
MRGFLNGIGKTRCLKGIEHQNDAVKIFIRNERKDGGLALLTLGVALVFLICGEDQNIPVVTEGLFFKTANEFGLIVFVGLADKYRDPFASFHQYLFACTVSQLVAMISLSLFYNAAISITIEMAVKIKNLQLVNL